MKIKLFTFSYPYGTTEQFLHDEVAFLVNQNIQVTLVPFNVDGAIREDLPNKVKVDKSMALSISKNSESKIIPLFGSIKSAFKALCQHEIRSISALRDVIGFLHHGRIIKNWALQNIKQHEILYTYWFERITYGLALYQNQTKSENLLITRAHRYDLYEEKRPHGFIPFRDFTLRYLDRLFVISGDGYDYFVDKYPSYRKIEIARLGILTKNTKSPSKESDDYVFVSCSSVISIKRVDFIFKVVDAFAELQNKQVYWYHFGDGTNFKILKGLVEKHSKKLTVKLQGSVDNKQLLSFYEKNGVDCFINLSDSEGIPVSIMEAISVGIPILARDVGGMREIVNETTGLLLNQNPSINEAVQGLGKVLEKDMDRDSIIDFFNTEYNAHSNFNQFYKRLIAIG